MPRSPRARRTGLSHSPFGRDFAKYDLINRQRVETVDDYRRLTARSGPGDVLTMYVYKPELNQRTLETITIDGR